MTFSHYTIICFEQFAPPPPILLFGTILLLNLTDLPPYTFIWPIRLFGTREYIKHFIDRQPMRCLTMSPCQSVIMVWVWLARVTGAGLASRQLTDCQTDNGPPTLLQREHGMILSQPNYLFYKVNGFLVHLPSGPLVWMANLVKSC